MMSPGPYDIMTAPPAGMRFPHCAACRRAPGRLCPPHGAALDPQPAETAEEPAA